MRPAFLAGSGLAVAALVFLGACAQAPSMTVERAPGLQIDRQAAATTVSKLEVLSLLRESSPAAAEFKLEDDRYFFVTRDWVADMHRWFAAFLAQQMEPERVQEFLRSRPRKVALMLESIAELQVQRDHTLKGQALVGVLSVECHRVDSQVPIDWDNCFYVIFGIREGFHVLEPVTGTIQPLRDFPLRESARRVSF